MPRHTEAPSSGLENFRFPWEEGSPDVRAFNRYNQDVRTNFIRRHARDEPPVSISETYSTKLAPELLNRFREMSRGEGGFNIDVSGIRNSLNQQAAAQRQNLVAGARLGAGSRLGARSGAAGISAVNQGFGASFGAQAAANTNLLSSAARTNLATRLSGVQGQRDILNFFQREAGQKADIGIRRGGLGLGREQLKITKEGQDLRAALEKRRLGIMSFTAREQAAFNKERNRIAMMELQEKIDQGYYGSSGGGFWGFMGDLAKGVAGAIGLYNDYKRATSGNDSNEGDFGQGEGKDYSYV